MAEEWWRRSAGELARLIAAREVSALEVVEAHLARIEAVNPALNAVVAVRAEEARAEAQAADRAVAAGAPLGPLHGVPCTVKENIDVAGMATTQGLHALAGAIASVDAPVVERMRAAGAIVIGRTNLPDMGLRVHTHSSLHGLTVNPWDRSRTTGGSSGGEGAALAAGMTPIGLGNDIGGSLRNPAHCCGIASIKPTNGRVPAASVIPPEDGILASQLMATDGPMARRVADVRLGLSIVNGPHVRSPFTAPVPLELPRPVERLRVAVMANPPGSPTDPGVAAGVRRAADALADAGYDVVEATPPAFEAAIEVWGRWLVTELRALRPLLAAVMGEDAMTFLDLVDSRYPEQDAAFWSATMVERHAVARQWAQWQADHHLLVCPTWCSPPFEHGFDISSEANAHAVLDLIRCVLPPNALGLPAAVVPAAVVDGLPVGVQVIADRWQDLLCLEAAEAVEQAVGTFTPIDPR